MSLMIPRSPVSCAAQPRHGQPSPSADRTAQTLTRAGVRSFPSRLYHFSFSSLFQTLLRSLSDLLSPTPFSPFLPQPLWTDSSFTSPLRLHARQAAERSQMPRSRRGEKLPSTNLTALNAYKAQHRHLLLTVTWSLCYFQNVFSATEAFR